MQGQHETAVSSDAVEIGVTNAPFYDNSYVEMHGRLRPMSDPGEPYQPLELLSPHEKCEDLMCARCTQSTTGENFAEPIRAGTAYDGEGAIPLAEPAYNDARIAEGTPDEAIVAIDSRHDPELCAVENCARCNDVNDAILQPGFTVVKGGGSNGTGRAKDTNGGLERCGCGMFNCGHLHAEKKDKKHAGGPKRKGERSRSTPHTVKVSAEAKPGLKVSGASELVDELGFAIAQGKITVDEARKKLLSQEAA